MSPYMCAYYILDIGGRSFFGGGGNVIKPSLNNFQILNYHVIFQMTSVSM